MKLREQGGEVAGKSGKAKQERDRIDMLHLRGGFLVATSFFALGPILNYVFPAVYREQ